MIRLTSSGYEKSPHSPFSRKITALLSITKAECLVCTVT